MVSTESVCMALRYSGCFFSSEENFFTIYTASSSARSSSLPYFGKSPSMEKSTAMPCALRTGRTLAQRIAERESAATESPATPKAMMLSLIHI